MVTEKLVPNAVKLISGDTWCHMRPHQVACLSGESARDAHALNGVAVFDLRAPERTGVGLVDVLRTGDRGRYGTAR